MKNNALIYRRPSKWPIAAALDRGSSDSRCPRWRSRAVEESPSILPAATDPTIIGVYFADTAPTPPDPDTSFAAARTGSGSRIYRT